jgi:hypothetical protein
LARSLRLLTVPPSLPPSRQTHIRFIAEGCACLAQRDRHPPNQRQGGRRCRNLPGNPGTGQLSPRPEFQFLRFSLPPDFHRPARFPGKPGGRKTENLETCHPGVPGPPRGENLKTWKPDVAHGLPTPKEWQRRISGARPVVDDKLKTWPIS